MLQKLSIWTFFSRNCKNITPIVAIDMSQYNMNRNGDRNLHSFGEQNTTIYLELVTKILASVRFISDKEMMPLAFGWKTKNSERVSDLFALNSIHYSKLLIDDFEEKYRSLVNKVKLSNPANHGEIISKLKMLSVWNDNSRLSTYFFHLHQNILIKLSTLY